VEDGELVTLVLEVEDERGVGNAEIEPVGAGGGVDAGDVPLGDPVAERQKSAGFVGGFGRGVLF
jgi:hypothetical protein